MPRIIADGKVTLGQQAYRELREQIRTGRLQPGQRLPLRSVAGSLGMSIAPVSEAFRELARDGLIEMEPGWGSRVRRLDLEALRSQHIFRMALECEGIRHCAECASDDELAALQAAADELDQRIESHEEPAETSKLNSAFHFRISQMSGVPSLVEALRANQLVHRLSLCSYLPTEKEMPRQHGLLVDAIRTHDPDQAERAMREHCVRAMQRQMAHFGRTALR